MTLSLSVADAPVASTRAAAIIVDHLRACASGTRVPRLGLATGRSPDKLYRRLLDHDRAGDVRLGEVTCVMLDEYLGLAADDPRRFCHVLEAQFLAQVPSGTPPLVAIGDTPTDVANFAAEIAAHPVDVQILGIGRNGHVGFNEPGSSFDSRTREVVLASTTRDDMIRAGWPSTEVPERAVTQGLADIAAASVIVLLAFGGDKAEALRGAVRGEAGPHCPASILQSHDNVHVFADVEAASLL